MHARRIAQGIAVDAALAEVLASPWWGQFPARTGHASPHSGTDDLWLRFRAPDELTSPAAYGEPHFATWYPAWATVPALRPIIYNLMWLVRAEYLGGVLVTRIPPGAQVAPHHDRGSWHSEWLGTKAYVILSANSRCVNRYETEEYRMEAGEAWLFDNQVTHSVRNDGDTPRIALIATMRTEIPLLWTTRLHP
jgi:hypothetical protein